MNEREVRLLRLWLKAESELASSRASDMQRRCQDVYADPPREPTVGERVEIGKFWEKSWILQQVLHVISLPAGKTK